MIQKFINKINADANLKELLSGSAVTFIIKVTGMVLGYCVLLLISKKYGAEGTGIYTLTFKTINLLAIFAGLGLNIALVRYVGQFSSDKNGLGKMKYLLKYVFQLSFPFSVFIALCLYFFATEIAKSIFNNPTYIPILKIAAIALPFFTLTLVYVEFIRGLKNLKVSEYLRSVNRQLVVLILVGFTVFSANIMGVVYALGLGILLSFILTVGYIFNYFKKHPVKKIISGVKQKELLITSVPLLSYTVATFIMSSAGAFFLEIYGTSDQVGIFNVCSRLAQLVSLTLLVVNTIAAPKFSELYWSNRKEELKKVLQQSSKIIFLSSIGVSLLLVGFSDLILSSFGEEFLVGSTALILLIVGQLINAFTGSVTTFLSMTGKQKALRNIVLITTCLVIPGYIFLVPLYGIEGAAAVFLFGSVFLNAIGVAYIYFKLKMVTFYVPFLKIK